MIELRHYFCSLCHEYFTGRSIVIASRIPKGMRALLTITFIMGCLLVLPLSAQESPPPTQQQASSTGVSGQAPVEGVQPGAQTPPVLMTDQQLIDEARLATSLKKPQPASLTLASNFEVQDYPNDSGGSFIIEWLFTPAEETARKANEAANKAQAETDFKAKIEAAAIAASMVV